MHVLCVKVLQGTQSDFKSNIKELCELMGI